MGLDQSWGVSYQPLRNTVLVGRVLKCFGPKDFFVAVSIFCRLKECMGSRNPKKEHICGKPLGLQFNKIGRKLYIADAYFGLLEVQPGQKFVVPVVTHVQGRKLQFTNALDIDQNSGVVYFTDSSLRFQRREFMKVIITGYKSGRVIRYDPRNKDVQVLLSNLSFPNGVLISSDHTFLIVAETTTCRILKYQLLPNNTKFEVLVDLPGFPDNTKSSPRGGFCVALHSRRRKLIRKVLSFPTWLRELFSYLGGSSGKGLVVVRASIKGDSFGKIHSGLE